MTGWNIFLVAIAFKHASILRYLVGNRKMSIKNCCRDPSASFVEAINPEERSSEDTFGLQLAI